MTDKELLELAAKAAGIEIVWKSPWAKLGDFAQTPHNKETGDIYDPLTDDGDALRLAVKLGMTLELNLSKATAAGSESALWIGRQIISHNDDPYAATRRAIVRAAAEIGKEKP